MMSANCKRLEVGLVTLLVLGTAWAMLVSPADAGKPQPPPAPPVRYTIQVLPLFADSTGSYVTGMNNLGHVVGRAYGPDTAAPDYVRGFLYTPATGTVDLNDTSLFPVPDGWWIPDPADINDSGQIAGIAVSPNCEHAFQYTPGVGFVDLGPPPEGYAYIWPRAINNLGDVAGEVATADAPPLRQTRAFVWTEEAGFVLLTGGDGDTYAGDINDLAEVSGTMLVNGERRAFRYTPGVGVVNLGVVARSKQGDSYSRGLGINNSGQVVGGSSARAYYERAFRYTDGQGMVSLGTLDDGQWTWSRALDVNSAGQVVGPASRSTGGNYRDQETRAFLWTDATGMLDLWSLIGNPPSGTTAGDIYIWQLLINDGVVLPNGGPSRFGRICGMIQGSPFILTPDR